MFLLPAKTTDTAPATAERLLDGVYAYVGLPREVISDQDVLFTAAFATALNRHMRIQQNFAVARRKEADGLAERQMRTVRQFLRAFCNESRTDWHTLLPAAMFACNSAINAATGLSPLHVLLGRAPSGPWLLGGRGPSSSTSADLFMDRRARVERRAAER